MQSHTHLNITILIDIDKGIRGIMCTNMKKQGVQSNTCFFYFYIYINLLQILYIYIYI